MNKEVWFAKLNVGGHLQSIANFFAPVVRNGKFVLLETKQADPIGSLCELSHNPPPCLFNKVVASLFMTAFLPLSFAGQLPVSPNQASEKLLVTANPGSELQLEVREMPMGQVLNSISEKTKVPIHYSVLPEGLLTATCVGSSLKPLLECVLNRKADLIVRYAQSSSNADNKKPIIEAWILGSKLEIKAVRTETCAGSAKTGSISLTESKPNQQHSADPSDQLLKVAKSDDVKARAEAISDLLTIGRLNDPNVKAMLEEAIHDENADIRAQAISTLTHREDYSTDNSAIIQEALHDNSVDVRLMAVDGIADDINLLEQAVNDSDETVRSFAQTKLEEILQNQHNQ